VFVPVANVLLAGDGTLTDSNGLAAGTTRPDAEQRAVLELVERDAVAIWWYGRIRRPSLPLSILENGGGALRDWLERRHQRRHTWLLDLTHDLGIPVVAALSADPDGRGIAYGFAARPHVTDAAISAVLEMLQSEISLTLAARRAVKTGSPGGPAGRLLVWSRSTAVGQLPFLLPCEDARRVVPAPANVDPLKAVAARGRRPVLFVDLDRPGDGLSVVRALIPGLRPWRPRFCRGRLVSVPRRLGWRRDPVDETTVGGDVILI
jgi:ribosomal protein S12 methylthiotransferase accessory factor